MHIGIDCLGAISSHSGWYTYLLNEIKSLAKIDTQNIYYLFISAKNEDIFGSLPSNFHKIFLKFSRHSLLRTITQQLILPFYIKKLKIKVFYAPNNFAPILCGYKSIVAIRSILFYYFPHLIPLQELICRAILIPLSIRKAKRILTVSEWMKREICNRCKIPLEKVEVICHGVNGNLFFHQQNVDFLKKFNIQSPYLLTVSVLWRYKNLNRLIEAFKIIKEEYRIKHKLVIVGKDDSRNMQKYDQLTKQLGVNNEVLFVGPVSQYDLKYFYSGADVFIFLSEIESFGLPLLEAMACEVPIIASNKTAIPEVVGDAGMLVDPHNIKIVAMTIYELISNSSLREELIKRGRQRIKQFDWLEIAKRLYEIFNR